MGFTVGNIAVFKTTWYDGSLGMRFVNLLRYRLTEGEISVPQMQYAIADFFSMVPSQQVEHMMDTTSLERIDLWNQSVPTDPVETQQYVLGSTVGVIAAALDEAPQASACIVRHCWGRGQQFIGRFFHGPLTGNYTDLGLLTVDPLLVDDLTDLADRLGNEIENAMDYTAVLRPIVCSATATTVTEQHDVRHHTFSPNVTYLRSRRPGQGM